MRDPPGQLPHHLHLLALPQLLLEGLSDLFGALFFGDVRDEPLDVQELAGLIVDTLGPIPNPARLPGSIDDAILVAAEPLRLQVRLTLLPQPVHVVGMHEVAERNLRVVVQLLHGIARQRQAPIADQVHGPRLVVLAAINHPGHMVEELSQRACLPIRSPLRRGEEQPVGKPDASILTEHGQHLPEEVLAPPANPKLCSLAHQRASTRGTQHLGGIGLGQNILHTGRVAIEANLVESGTV